VQYLLSVAWLTLESITEQMSRNRGSSSHAAARKRKEEIESKTVWHIEIEGLS